MNECIINLPGVIDNDFTDSIKVILRNSSSKDYEVKKSTAIAQLLIYSEPLMSAVAVEHDGTVCQAPLSVKAFRGNAGFGSSDQKK